MRGLEAIAEDADGFSRSTFSTRDGVDYGFGGTRSIVATIDGDDIDHEISADLDADVAEPLARLLNDVHPLIAEIRRLRERQAEHLRMIASLAQSTPLDDEVSQALAQRGSLLAEVGTLRARIAELEVGIDETAAVRRARIQLDDPEQAGSQFRFAIARDVLALASENARLRDDEADSDATRERLAKLLKRTAIAMKGPEPELVMWDWSDLPTIAAAWRDALETARDRLDPEQDDRALDVVRQALSLAKRDQEET